MNNDPLKGFLQIGIFVGGGGILLAFMVPSDSPEFVASVCSGIIGMILVIGVVVLMRVTRSD